MVTILILSLNDNRITLNLDILCIRDDRKSKMLSDLRTNLSSITIDSLTTCDDKIIVELSDCSCNSL